MISTRHTEAVPDLEGDANVSIDVDTLDCYRRIHGLGERRRLGDVDPVWEVGIGRALDVLDEFGLSATFFVVGRDLEAPAHRRLLRRMVDEGHEVANHTQDHRYDLRRLPEPELAHQLQACDRAITDVTGRRPVGFRTPGYNVDADVIAFSRRAGHRYDASVFPCASYWVAKYAVMKWRRLRGDESKSERTDLNTLLAPRQPYFPDPMDCTRAAATAGSYVEIPMATAALGLIPLIGTSLHVLQWAGLDRLWPFIDASFPRFLSFEMHAIDFVEIGDLRDEPDAGILGSRQPDLGISWAQKKHRYRRLFDCICSRRVPVTLAEATESISAAR